MILDWLIAGPIFAFTIWVFIREFRGHGKKGCSSCSAQHKIYGFPDVNLNAACSECPVKKNCKHPRQC